MNNFQILLTFIFSRSKGLISCFFFCVVKNYSDGCRNKGLFRVEIASCRRSCPRAKIMNAGVTHQLPLLINKLIWEDRDGQKNLIRFDQGPSTSVYLLGELRIENFSSEISLLEFGINYKLCKKSIFKIFFFQRKTKVSVRDPKKPLLPIPAKSAKNQNYATWDICRSIYGWKGNFTCLSQNHTSFSQHLKHIPLKMKKNKRRRSFGTIEYRQERGLILETFKPKFPIITILILL